MIDGMEMDVVADIRAPDLATLDLYCDRVASAVGRLSVQVFGLDATSGRDLAHHLGRALQLTNILRDIDEDAAIGRLYLPQRGAAGSGDHRHRTRRCDRPSGARRACAPIIARIREHFARADAIMNAAPRRAVRAPRIMGAAYKGRYSRRAGSAARGLTRAARTAHAAEQAPRLAVDARSRNAMR